MSDNYHKEIERWARQQRDDFYDNVDDRNHPTARLIYNNIQKLEDAAQSGRNLRSLHDQMRIVERQAEQAKHTANDFLSINHAHEMRDTFRSYADSLRKHPDY